MFIKFGISGMSIFTLINYWMILSIIFDIQECLINYWIIYDNPGMWDIPR